MSLCIFMYVYLGLPHHSLKNIYVYMHMRYKEYKVAYRKRFANWNF